MRYKPNFPFMFKPARLLIEDFKTLVKENWIPYHPGLEHSIASKFMYSLKLLKGNILELPCMRRRMGEGTVKDVEEKMVDFSSKSEGFIL